MQDWQQIFGRTGNKSINIPDRKIKVMRHFINYSYVCNKGKCRSLNQDNISCNGFFYPIDHDSNEIVSGCLTSSDNAIMAIFDGLGGEEQGEVASYIAAEFISGRNGKCLGIGEVEQSLIDANNEICRYAEENKIGVMGTTAALLGFYPDEIVLSNIGDSKIFRYSDGILEQISRDHISPGIFGRKPPLSQFLGIPSSEMRIVPYMAHGYYNKGDIYLICSDGLSDMLDSSEIEEIIGEKPIDIACDYLLNKALNKGGKDNITLVICKIEKRKLF